MSNRSIPLRWISVILLIALLGTGLVSQVTAQEEGPGAPATTESVDSSDQVLTGDDTGVVVDAETPTPEVTPDVATETPTAVPTETPTAEGETDTDTGESTPEGEPVGTVESSPTPEQTPEDVVEPASVGVSVTIYNCVTGYGGGDPASDGSCAPASGVGVSATADGAAVGSTVTDGSGVASFDVLEASQVTFVEDQLTLPSGYVPNGNGSASLSAAAGASASIVNIEVQTAGRLQISNGYCPTSGDARSQFIVVGPLAVQSAALGCEPRPGASLTISGTGGTYPVVTDGSGNWVGTLPVGDYTVSNENGEGYATVRSGSTTIVLVVDYVPGPKGTLTIQRFDCADGDEGTTIDIDGGPKNDTCVPSDKQVEVASVEGSAAPLSIDLGEDGSTSIDVAAGAYVVTDGPSGVSAEVTVDEGSSVTAAINSTIRTGVVSASIYWCSAAVSSAVNPGEWGSWANRCSPAEAGTVISLLDSSGGIVSTASTGGSGTVSFTSLLPGIYSLTSSNGCALFANGADARNGFSIVAGGTVDVAAFGCAAPQDIPEQPDDSGTDPGTIGGGWESGGAIGGDDGFGNVPLGSPAYHSRNLTVNPLSNVSTLPETGEGKSDATERMMMLLLAFAALAAGAAFQLAPDRRKRRA